MVSKPDQLVHHYRIRRQDKPKPSFLGLGLRTWKQQGNYSEVSYSTHMGAVTFAALFTTLYSYTSMDTFCYSGTGNTSAASIIRVG